MSYSTAIFVDFENLRKIVFDNEELKHDYFFDYNSEPQKVVDFCNLCVFNSSEEDDLKELYRIFFYTARPLEYHPSFKKINSFLDTLQTLNHSAVRLGKLVKRNEAIIQKQVDMLLGLDIAEVSIKRFINKAVLIGYDSDMSPVLKLARCNGIQTEIILFEDIKTPYNNLFKHCDIVKKVKVRDLYEKLKIDANKHQHNPDTTYS